MNILITGAGSGIGLSLGIRLAKRGHFIYLTTHTKKEVKRVSEIIKDENLEKNITVFKLDITKEKDRALIEKVSLDALVNLAAIGMGRLLENDILKIKQVYETNVFSTLELTKRFISNYKNKKTGKVLITSSLASIIPFPNMGVYSSTKASLSMIAKSLKHEVKDKNIKIKLIEPGAYYTGFNEFMLNDLDEETYLKEKRLFRLIESKNTNSIERKMVKALESNTSKLKYRAPIIQSFGAKLYAILFQ